MERQTGNQGIGARRGLRCHVGQMELWILEVCRGWGTKVMRIQMEKRTWIASSAPWQNRVIGLWGAEWDMTVSEGI